VLGLAAALPTYVQRRWQRQLPEAVTALCWRMCTDQGRGNLLAAGADGRVVVHSAAGDERHAWQAHDGGVTRLCRRPRVAGASGTASESTAALATAGEDGRVRLWDDRGAPIATLTEEPGWVEHLTWTPDGRILAAAAGRSIHLWQDLTSLGVWYDAARTVLALAWAPDSRRLATAANKGLHLWQVGGQAPVQLLRFPGAPVVLDWRPDGKALAVGTQDGFLQLWRQSRPGGRGKAGGSSQLMMRGYPAKVTCLDWHPTRSRIATAGGPDLVIWDIPDAGEGRATPLRLHREAITVLAYAPNGALLASGDRSGRLCIWQDGGTPVQSIGLEAEISALDWHPDGTAIAVGCTDGRVAVLDIDPSARTGDLAGSSTTAS